MSGYAKLFSEIVDSSIWDEDSDTCKVWITLLALADQDGYVRGSEGWLAGKSRVSLGKCVLALRKFKEPDIRSRTPDNEGKRIEQLSDGWLILNYIAFRDKLSTDPKASATRERVRKHRERYKALQSVTTQMSASASASVSVRDGGTGEGAVIPSWDEWWSVCQMVGIPEWRALDEFNKQQAKDIPWKDARRSLPHHAARVKTWWEADGRNLSRPTKPGQPKSRTEMDYDRELKKIENMNITLPPPT